MFLMHHGAPIAVVNPENKKRFKDGNSDLWHSYSNSKVTEFSHILWPRWRLFRQKSLRRNPMFDGGVTFIRSRRKCVEKLVLQKKKKAAKSDRNSHQDKIAVLKGFLSIDRLKFARKLTIKILNYFKSVITHNLLSTTDTF